MEAWLTNFVDPAEAEKFVTKTTKHLLCLIHGVTTRQSV